MKLHESSNFADAITRTSDLLDIRPEYIEKDYWVTYVLKKLAQSPFVDHVVFKGGTCLSKAHRCLNRFSEDIDLALLPQPELSESKRKKLLSAIDHTVGDDLTYLDGMKKGRNRFSNYGYPQQFPMADNQPVKSHIKVELNAFSNPVPHKMMQISSYLYDFLLENGNQDIIEEFELQPFHLNVLSLERTFFEKVLALNRFSYLGIEPLIGKLRHFFDLHQLYNKTYLKDCIFNDENLEILDMVRKDDERLKTFHGDWLGKPLAASPLFTSLEETWKKIAPQYFQDLEMLTWGLNLPSSEQILKVMGLIKSFLEKYDERSKLLESDKPINSMAETTG